MFPVKFVVPVIILYFLQSSFFLLLSISNFRCCVSSVNVSLNLSKILFWNFVGTFTYHFLGYNVFTLWS